MFIRCSLLCVDTANIIDGAVTAPKIGALAVETAKINNLAVTESKLGNLAVTEGKLGPLAVTEGKIGDLAVETAKINNLAVTEGKIGNLAVNVNKVKCTSGSWSINIPAASTATTTLNNYSHFPKQSDTTARISSMFLCCTGTAEAYIISAQNSDPSNPRLWTGAYDYHSASESIIDLLYAADGITLLGVHVTEKGNEKSMRLYDREGKESKAVFRDIVPSERPDLFTDRQEALYNASEIMQLFTAQ